MSKSTKTAAFYEKPELLMKFFGWVSAGVMLFNMVLICCDVFMRYVFNSPIQGATEIVTMLMAWVAYAGMAHTSWIMPYAMPKFFAKEKTSVVEFSVGEPSEINTLCGVWDREHPYFRKQALFYWQGREARLLGRQAGFDYALILP